MLSGSASRRIILCGNLRHLLLGLLGATELCAPGCDSSEMVAVVEALGEHDFGDAVHHWGWLLTGEDNRKIGPRVKTLGGKSEREILDSLRFSIEFIKQVIKRAPSALVHSGVVPLGRPHSW